MSRFTIKSDLPVKSRVIRRLRIIFGVCLLTASATSIAQEIRLIAAGANRAIIEVDGERIILSDESPSHGNAQLVSTSSDEVILNFAGQKFTLTTESDSKLIHSEPDNQVDKSAEPVVIWADNSGFFMVEGKIDDRPIEFLVDTGADIVTLSSEQAERLGIDYASGRDGYAATASGVTPLKSLSVRKLSVGHLTQYDVEISVIEGRFPDVPLLGGSFLNKYNMYRVGNRMEISRN